MSRGRAERILVVTPRAIVERFQHEMWTKFAIPLVRLDSDGIRKVRRTLPASRNPFSYYRRVIASIDTLKNPDRYRHFLASQRWDVVVIDECHNVINPRVQNHHLAELLARRTDALILSGATPHNGRPESFAGLIELLDPTAIRDTASYTAPDIQALLAEPQRVWPQPGPGGPPAGSDGDNWRRLFPRTLHTSFLSSPEALQQTIDRRMTTARGRDDPTDEVDALLVLERLNRAVAASGRPSSMSSRRT